jgi:TonB family protein
MSLVRLGRAGAVCALLFGGGVARADQPVVAPPRLAHSVEAVDPRPAGDAARVTVELELEIDRDGRVGAVKVVGSASPELDAAASDAARAFAFEPATRDGQPIPARIRYAYVFAERSAAPPLAMHPAATAGVSVTVVDQETGKPLAGADVLVTTDAGATFQAKTDSAGQLRIDQLPLGPVHVVVSAPGHVPQRFDEALEEGVLTEAKLRLELTPDPEAFGATARVEAPPREVTKRTLSATELTKVAGTRGDPLRAIELLPGVSRGTGDSTPILRGANPDDSQVFLEGMPAPLLYHFGGLTSFVHSRVLESVDLYPSNFSVRYGRKSGGVIEARLRDPRTDGLHGIAEVGLLDSSLVVETPIGETVSALAAVRRSNIDAVLNSAASTADLAITAAPVYWDYQAVGAWKPTDQDRIRLLAYGSRDSFRVLYANPADATPAVRGAFGGSTEFHRVQLGYRHRWSAGSEQNTELTYGRADFDTAFGTLGQQTISIDSLQARSEWVGVPSSAVRVVGGIDALANYYNASYQGIPTNTGEGIAPQNYATLRHIAVDARKWSVRPGAYLEAGLRPVPKLLLVPGVRADWDEFVGRVAIDPRFSTRYEVTDTTTLKGGVGQYSQEPDEKLAVDPIGNPNLKLTRAIHVSAGVEEQLTDTFSASGEGFVKWLDDVVAPTPDGRAPFFVNSEKGRIYGGELLLRVKPRGRFFGFVSYTLMRSERLDAGQPWRLFDRDQTHILNATAAYRLGRGWEVGASFRYTSGTPYTPVVASTYEATTDTYTPRSGPPLSERNPPFVRLDLRGQKTWTFSKWSLAVFLDVQNALNSPNREGFDYSYDYRSRTGARGLPILPLLGVRGEL